MTFLGTRDQRVYPDPATRRQGKPGTGNAAAKRIGVTD
jgi:hypothetical protein